MSALALIRLAMALALLWPMVVQADITSNLTLWYKLNDATGTTATDSSASALSGTLGMGGTAPAWTTSCVLQGCLTFNGVTNLVLSTGPLAPSIVTVSAGTIAAWIKPTGTASDATSASSLPAAISDSDGLLGIGRGTISGANDRLYVWLNDGAVKSVAIPYTVGVWQHVAMTWTGGTLSGYLNGALVSSTAAGSLPCAPDNLNLGKNHGSAFATGNLDEVRLYSRGLSATDVRELYSQGLPRKRRPLLLNELWSVWRTYASLPSYR